jgi:hypothetical protein
MITKSLFTDKIFRFYYFKNYNTTEYEQFNDLPDKEKINFLINLFLYVSKKKEIPNANNGDIFFSTLGTRYITNQPRTENMKENEAVFSHLYTNQNFTNNNSYNNNLDNYIQRRSSFSFQNNAKISIATNALNTNERTETMEVSEIKENFKSILKKYSQNAKSNVNAEFSTKDIHRMINNIESTIMKNSHLLDNYIKENNESIHTNTINVDTKNVVKITETQKLNDALYYSNFYNFNNQPIFHKGDFNKSLLIKQTPENLVILNDDFYEVDNIEIFMEYPEINNKTLNSENNEIFVNLNDHHSRFKILRDKNQKCYVDKVNFVLFNQSNPNVLMNPSKSKISFNLYN